MDVLRQHVAESRLLAHRPIPAPDTDHHGGLPFGCMAAFQYEHKAHRMQPVFSRLFLELLQGHVLFQRGRVLQDFAGRGGFQGLRQCDAEQEHRCGNR